MFPITVQAMHIPDGFLSLVIALTAWVLAVIFILMAIRNSQESFDEKLVPLAGIMAAFIFAGQMINFPVAGGTSGHFIGAALAAVVLGPWLGILVMTAVIALQALLFQDGGLVVMGANILAMGVVPALISYGLYRAAANRNRRVQMLTVAGGAWLSVMGGALLVSLLLGFSGTSSFRVVVPAMLGIHALIGLGEALITVAALSLIMNTRPQLLQTSAEAGGRGWIVGGIAVTLLIVLISPFASGFPDGLEWVAEESGFLHTAVDAPFQILPDYTIPVLGETGLSTIVAGIVGALVVAAITFGLARLLRGKKLETKRLGTGD
ncbi:MAG: PDGLE domain-containing protein [Ardenticatenaceae bacterium]|nr:PDGLE domain-containing protein [Ardenticatenaceae bacterium]MCB9445075.1 PDGLE domain-containing protein [Ardenticatenaceae bacterium]